MDGAKITARTFYECVIIGKDIIGDSNSTVISLNTKALLLSSLWGTMLILSCVYWILIIGKKKILFSAMLLTIFGYFTGTLFSYYIIIPQGLTFLAEWINTNNLTIELELKSLIQFCLVLMIITSILFEFPVYLIVNFKLGVINRKFLLKNYRFGFYLILSFAALLTPPDLFTFLSLAIPVSILYMVTILSPFVLRSRPIKNPPDLLKIQKGKNYLSIFAILQTS